MTKPNPKTTRLRTTHRAAALAASDRLERIEMERFGRAGITREKYLKLLKLEARSPRPARLDPRDDTPTHTVYLQ